MERKSQMMLRERNTLRLEKYDYCQNGIYFITLVAFKRGPIFASLSQNKIELTEYGNILKEEWLATAKLRKNVEIKEFVIMPDHFHALLFIQQEPVGAWRAMPVQRQFGNLQKNSLSSIMGGFKSAVSKRLHEIGFNGPVWQRNYYEHIIRNDHQLLIAQEYILNNPKALLLDVTGTARHAPTIEMPNWT